MQDQDTESKSLNVGRDILNCRRSRKTTNMLSVHHYQPCSNNSPNTYERCQVSFGRFIVDFIRWFLGCWQAFLTAPLTRRESQARGAVGKVCRVFECWSLERFHFEGLGLRFCLSFQTPIRASEFRSERQFDLFVSVKWNVDAVQSIGDERL